MAIHEAGHAAAGHVYLEKEVLSTRLSIRKRGGSLGHYQGMEKDERFSHFRSRVMGSLIMTLGAMAAEHVFYGENSQGVSGDVASATATAAAMVGVWGDGRRPGSTSPAASSATSDEHVLKRLERIGTTIMNRAAGRWPMSPRTPSARSWAIATSARAAAQILGQAYVTAYALMAANREALERIADTLVRAQGDARRRGRRAARPASGWQRPEIDLMDDSTWPSGMSPRGSASAASARREEHAAERRSPGCRWPRRDRARRPRTGRLPTPTSSCCDRSAHRDRDRRRW